MMLYKHQGLVQTAFDLLVRYFTRRHTLMENLRQI